jgi:hypothetical protein
MWVKPNQKDADREHPRPKETEITLASVIVAFTVMPSDCLKLSIPDHVAKKLENYVHCLFGPVDYVTVDK